MAGVRFERITKTFGKVIATNDVSLTVADGEFIVLLGPSGCGKTTLLRCLAGLEKVDAGRILIGERDVTELPPGRRRIAMVFQSYAVFPHMTLYDNIAFGLKMQKESKATIKERVDSVAELVHIEDLLERYPAQISGGQRQRVALARAIATKADVLLMDEPLSNLDALLRMEMRAELKALLRQLGTTTIYVTHDQVEALSMGDRIAVMKAGVIAQVDTPLAVYDHPADTYVGGFVGTPPMNFLHAEVSVNGGPPVVQLNGGSFTLTGADGAGLAGKQLTLGIRAEAIRVHTDATEGCVPAKVIVVEPLGSHNLLTVRIGEDLLKVATPPDLFPAPDSDVWLELDPARIRWMDRESGHAVAARRRRRRAARGRGSRSMSSAQAPRAAALDYRPSFPRAAVRRRDRRAAAPRRRTSTFRRTRRGTSTSPACTTCCRRAVDGVRERFPFVRRVYGSLDEVLADPEVAVVDIATRPAERPALILQAIEAGKHVLAQKPLALDLESARRVVEAAERGGREAGREPERPLVPAAPRRHVARAAGRRRRRRRRHAPPRQEHAAGRRPALRRARPLRDLRLRRPLDRHQPLLARRRPAGRGARVRLPRAGPARQRAQSLGRERRDPLRERRERPHPHGRRRAHRARRRAVLDPRHRGHDPRQRPARLGLPRARSRRRGHAVRARGCLVPGGARGDDGRAAVARSPRTASRTTRPATTCCRSS